MLSADLILISVVIVLALAHAVMHYREAVAERDRVVAERRRERVLRLIVDYLSTWAEMWDRPPAEVKAALKRVKEAWLAQERT